MGSFDYVEVARYVPKLKAVIREKRNDQAVMLKSDELAAYRFRHQNRGVYTSVFKYKRPDLESPRRAPMFFDLDAEEHVPDSYRDTKELYNYLSYAVPKDAIRVYFTGAKGFHIEVDEVVLGASPSMNLAATYRLVAEILKEELNLTTIDFGVYEPRRMWRMVNSEHQKTGLYKIQLEEEELFTSLDAILNAAIGPRENKNINYEFNPMANQWLKGWVTELETIETARKEQAALKRAEAFNKYGTSILNGPSQKYVKSVWRSALEVLRAAEPNKERNTVLSRQAYRLYITALQANIDLDTVTSKLEDIGIGMGLGQREVQATLRSAQRGAHKRYEEEKLNA